jgi:hypothetical protein
MPRKDVFLSQEEIDYIKNKTGGKYSVYIRTAVQEKIEKEKQENKKTLA